MSLHGIVVDDISANTKFESLGRMFVIEVVHIQWSEPFNGLEYAVMSIVRTVNYKEPLKSFEKSRA